VRIAGWTLENNTGFGDHLGFGGLPNVTVTFKKEESDLPKNNTWFKDNDGWWDIATDEPLRAMQDLAKKLGFCNVVIRGGGSK